MKKSILLNFLEYFQIRDYGLSVEENGLKMDFSRVNYSQSDTNSIKNTSEKKSIISSFIMLVLFFLFTNFLFAQQPACNLNGILESLKTRDGGQDFVINSEVYKAVPGTVYRWEFRSNNSAATFVTANGLPNMTIKPGNKNGEFNVKLTITNPPQSRTASSKTCSCTKSVSIGNN